MQAPLAHIASPFDLHVLGTPPAFILSQDQTLNKSFVLNPDQHLVDPIRLSDLKSDDLLLGLLSLVFDYF